MMSVGLCGNGIDTVGQLGCSPNNEKLLKTHSSAAAMPHYR